MYKAKQWHQVSSASLFSTHFSGKPHATILSPFVDIEIDVYVDSFFLRTLELSACSMLFSDLFF